MEELDNTIKKHFGRIQVLTSSIVLYKTNHTELSNAIASFFPSSTRHLILIDNSPTDDLKNFANSEYITYIKNPTNSGYGSAHNIGIKKAIELGSKYHIVLNPDIEFTPLILAELTSYMDANPDVGYLLPKVTYADGELQYLCKLLPTPGDLIFRRFLPKWKFLAKKNDLYTLMHSGYDKTFNPPCLSGCFMLLNLEIIKKHDLFFDEKYFMYCEDFDLIRRIHRVAKTVFYPECTIIHNHAKQSYKSKKMLNAHIKSAIYYFNKFGWFFDKERKHFNNLCLAEIDSLK